MASAAAAAVIATTTKSLLISTDFWWLNSIFACMLHGMMIERQRIESVVILIYSLCFEWKYAGAIWWEWGLCFKTINRWHIDKDRIILYISNYHIYRHFYRYSFTSFISCLKNQIRQQSSLGITKVWQQQQQQQKKEKKKTTVLGEIVGTARIGDWILCERYKNANEWQIFGANKHKN